VAEVTLAALGLNYGPDWSKSFFASNNKQVILRLLAEKKPRSFAEADEFLKSSFAWKKLKIPLHNWRAGSHGPIVIEGLAQVLPMNLGDGGTKIELSDCLSAPGITYFGLPSLIQPIVASALARCVIHELVAAASVHKGPRVPVYLIIDEADRIMTHDIGAVFSKARSLGISLILAHQSMNQLRTSEADFVPIVTQNTPTKIYFGPFLDREASDVIEAMGGETTEWFRGSDSTGRESEREMLVKRLGARQRMDVALSPGRAFVNVSPGEGFAQYKWPVAVDVPFTMSKEQYLEFVRKPWPTEGAIVAIDYKQPATPPPPADKPKPLGPLFNSQGSTTVR
jgi:hypothetical protein